MKIPISCVLVLALMVSLSVSCAREVKTYTDPSQTIDMGLNQEFVITLDSGSTSGYSWYVSYDESMLELVEKTYEPSKEAKTGVVGAGGVEYWRFKALRRGETEVTLVYKREGQEVTPQDATKAFTFNIK